MDSPRLDRQLLPFLMGVPLAWAVLLLFHGPGPDDDVYGSLRDEASRWIVVHVGSVVFVGLMGAVLYLLVRDLPGTAARISRMAIAPFVLFYAAGEAIVGIATGVIVDHANGAPAGERPALADVADAMYNSTPGDLLIGLGALAGAVAIVAAAVAYSHAGAPRAVSILLGLSAILVWHASPIGPAGLALFVVAVAVLARSRREAPAVETPAPRSAMGAGA